MLSDVIWRTASLCLALASAETLHGIVRTVWIAPRLGKLRAQRWSVVTGSALAFGLCWWWVPPMALHGHASLWGLGCVLALFMASFDVALGMLVLRRPWRRALSDLDPRTGNLLLWGLGVLVMSPWLVMRLHGQA